MNKQTYTGFNRILKSDAIQAFLNRKTDGSIRDFLNDWKWIFEYSKKYK